MVNSTTNLYNFTDIGASNTLFDFVKTVNDQVNSTLFVGILFISFIIMFISFKQYGNKDAFLASSFITATLSILLSAINLIPVKVTIIFVVSFAGTLAFMTFRKSYDD